MANKMKKFRIILVSCLVLIVLVSLANLCLAAAVSPLKDDTAEIKRQADALAGNTGAGFNTSMDVTNIVGNFITGFLALLGIIFIVLIILAGYNWMTAAGEEEKVNKAKDTLTRAIIGLVITVGAYAISQFVMDRLLK